MADIFKPLDLMDNPPTTEPKKNSPAQHGQCFSCCCCKLRSKMNAKSEKGKRDHPPFLSFVSILNGIKPKLGNMLLLNSVLSWVPACKPGLWSCNFLG